MTTLLPEKICFVDIETTGMSLRGDRIIEIGILRVENGEIVKTFSSLINPQTHIPPEIELLTGIRGVDVVSAPSFYELKQQIKDILDDCVFVAHNVRFDYSFLKTEFKRFDMEFSPKQFCTVKLSRALFPQYRHHNLDAIIQRFGFVTEKRHRAFDDAKILWEFYLELQKLFSLEALVEALNKVSKRPTIPLHLPTEQLDNLPERPGVYIFYGENDLPLYIGKSVNIRSRVLNHFSSDHLSSFELKIAQQVKRIDVQITAGELGALLKESQLIKQMQPLYNRKLKQKYKLLAVKSVTDSDGYMGVEFMDAAEIDVEQMSDIIGVFRSRRAALAFLLEKQKEFQLCERLLGLEHNKDACFSYRLGKCKGACVKKELAVMYNFRFQQAFYEHRLQSWPYATPIIVKEIDSADVTHEGYILDKWCYVGSITQQGQDNSLQISRELEFDLDTYKILRSFLKSKKGILIEPINVSQLSLL